MFVTTPELALPRCATLLLWIPKGEDVKSPEELSKAAGSSGVTGLLLLQEILDVETPLGWWLMSSNYWNPH